MKKQFTLQELAAFTETKLIGDPNHVIVAVETLELAEESDASFLANPNYEKAMHRSSAGVIFVTPAIALPEKKNFLVGDNPSQAFQKTAEALIGKRTSMTGFHGIHPTAIVHPSATVSKNVNLGPYVVVDEGAIIGEGTTINSHCYVGPYSSIGKDCFIHSHVVIRERCQIGNRVILQPGSIIGSCGFGYTTNREGKHTKLNQIGSVTLGDDVEIGANTTVDRARFKNTEIGQGTKIDNLVQIGHGVSVGKDNIIVSLTGIAGSTKLGDRVILAGQVAVAGHLSICNDVMVGGRSGISKSITTPGKYAGLPLLPLNEHQRNSVLLRNIAKYVQKIKDLEQRE